MKLKPRKSYTRTHRNNYRAMFCHPEGPYLWYNVTKRIWERHYNEVDEYSRRRVCHSIRAFRRFLKQAPAGSKFVLVGYNRYNPVYGVGTNSITKK